MSSSNFKERAEYRFWTNEQEAELVRLYCLEGMRASEIVKVPLFADSQFSNTKIHSKVKNLRLSHLRKDRKAAKAKVAELLAGPVNRKHVKRLSKAERLMRQRQDPLEKTRHEDIYSTDEEIGDDRGDSDFAPEHATVLLKEELHAHVHSPTERVFKLSQEHQKRRMDPQTMLNLMELRVATARQLDASLLCPVCFIRGFDMKHPAEECPDLDKLDSVNE